jgi:hypothetical protein
MERTLIEAWQKIEANELLLEKQKKGKVACCKKSLGKVTAVKKLDEDGVGGPAGAGVGAASNTASKSDTIVKSGAAAVAPAKLGKKLCKEDIKSDASAVAQNSVRNVKSGKGNATDATLVGSMVSEEDVPGEEIVDPHAEGPEAAADAELIDPAAEEGNENVSVDAETAEQVITAISQQYPGAVITISVQLPEGTPFDTDIVAAAQEVVGGATDDIAGAEEVAPEADAEIAPEGGEEVAPEELLEKRKVIITKTRKQIKEMFARMHEEGADEIAPVEGGEEIAPEAGLETDPAAEVAPPEGDTIAPEVEVGDTKIALSPEQWGQVLATTDLLNGAVGGEETGEVAPEAGIEGEEGDIGGEEEVAPETEIDELRTTVDLSKDGAKMEIKKPAQMNESFNNELSGYADALQKMMRN